MCDCDQKQISNIRETNISQACFYVFTEEERDTCCTLKGSIEDYGQLVVCVFGLLFNTITMLLFINKNLSCVFFNRLLLCLSIVGNVYLIITILDIWLSQNPSFYHQYTLYFVVTPARDITMCCTIYMTVILALERYSSTVRPQINPNRASQVSWRKVLKFVAPVVLFSTLFKLPSFFEFEIENTSESFDKTKILVEGPWYHNYSKDVYNTSTRIVVTNMRVDELYILLYLNIANITVTGVIPLALLA